MWISPDGKLRWTWADRDGSGAVNDQLWMLTLDAELEPPAKLPEPQYVGSGVMMCKPLVFSDGTWLFPLAKR